MSSCNCSRPDRDCSKCHSSVGFIQSGDIKEVGYVTTVTPVGSAGLIWDDNEKCFKHYPIDNPIIFTWYDNVTSKPTYNYCPYCGERLHND